MYEVPGKRVDCEEFQEIFQFARILRRRSVLKPDESVDWQELTRTAASLLSPRPNRPRPAFPGTDEVSNDGEDPLAIVRLGQKAVSAAQLHGDLPASTKAAASANFRFRLAPWRQAPLLQRHGQKAFHGPPQARRMLVRASRVASDAPPQRTLSELFRSPRQARSPVLPRLSSRPVQKLPHAARHRPDSKLEPVQRDIRGGKGGPLHWFGQRRVE